MPAPVLLLDGASMWFRSYFGVPSSITSPDGRPVNAVRGFIDAMAVVITQQRPGRLVVCLDLDWRPQFRVDLIPSYKAHRVAEPEPAGEPDIEEVPDDLSPQVDMIMELLDAFGIPTAGAPGFEADDGLGTLAARQPGRGGQRGSRPAAGGGRRSGPGSGALPGPRAEQSHPVRARRGGRTLW